MRGASGASPRRVRRLGGASLRRGRGLGAGAASSLPLRGE